MANHFVVADSVRWSSYSNSLLLKVTTYREAWSLTRICIMLCLADFSITNRSSMAVAARTARRESHDGKSNAQPHLAFPFTTILNSPYLSPSHPPTYNPVDGLDYDLWISLQWKNSAGQTNIGLYRIQTKRPGIHWTSIQNCGNLGPFPKYQPLGLQRCALSQLLVRRCSAFKTVARRSQLEGPCLPICSAKYRRTIL